MIDNKEIYTPSIGSIMSRCNSKLLNVIFMVDISNNDFSDRMMEIINEAFTQMIPVLRQIEMDYMSEFEFKVSIMTFDKDVFWHTLPIEIMDYNFIPIDIGYDMADYDKAFIQLNKKLTRKEFMAHSGKNAQPLIILVVNSEPNEDSYEQAANSLLENGWFNNSKRWVIFTTPRISNSQKARLLAKKFVTDELYIINDMNEFTMAELIIEEESLRTRARYHRLPICSSVDIEKKEKAEAFFDVNYQFGNPVDFSDDDFI